jgi:O-antigen/teichoic acid export membrane protein
MSGVQSAARQRGIVALHDASGQWLRGIVAWIAVSLFSATAAFALWGQLAASLAVLSSQSFFLWRLFRSQVSGGTPKAVEAEPICARAMWRFSWPFAVWGSLYWCGAASERWAITTFCGLSAVGIYQAAYQLGFSPILFGAGAIQAFASPIVFEKVGDASNRERLLKAHRLIAAMTKWTVVATLGLVSVCWVIGPFLYRHLTSASYAGGVRLLPLAILSAGLFSAGQFLSLDYLSARQSGRLIVPKATSSALAVALVWVGAKEAGPIGVLVASASANLAYLILSWVLCPGRKLTSAQGLATEDGTEDESRFSTQTTELPI